MARKGRKNNVPKANRKCHAHKEYVSSASTRYYNCKEDDQCSMMSMDTMSINSDITFMSLSNGTIDHLEQLKEFDNSLDGEDSITNFEADLELAFDQCCNSTKKSRRNTTVRINSLDTIRKAFHYGNHNQYIISRSVCRIQHFTL